MKTVNLLALAGSSLLLVATTNAQAQYKIVYFLGSTGLYVNHGANPRGDLTAFGPYLYGMTTAGGSNDNGVVFRISPDGSGYTNLHYFAGGTNDGCIPFGSLTPVGSTLYGMTSNCGHPSGGDGGTLFRVNTDGSGYTNLHFFTDESTDGGAPYGSLTLVGSTLYGTTSRGGTYNGTIFNIQTNGTGFTILHNFVCTPAADYDGCLPEGSLTLVGSVLYGMTENGGTNGYSGTVFKLNTNGTGYATLHNFTGFPNDGANPQGNLTLSGSSLYGMTRNGGSAGYGTIFRINLDGSGYTNLHFFLGGYAPNSDGANPLGSLTLVGSALYGVTANGGSNETFGTVFKLDFDGGYTNLYHFGGKYLNDGGNPFGSLILIRSCLYGMTYAGGPGLSDGDGIIFSVSISLSYKDWQVQHFGCTNCSQAAETADPDGDGQNNMAEFLAGTDPTNSASTFQITSVTPTNNDALIAWKTAGGGTNIVQATTDLSSYSNISPNIVIVGSGDTATNYLDAGATTNQPSRFYRVLLMP